MNDKLTVIGDQKTKVIFVAGDINLWTDFPHRDDKCSTTIDALNLLADVPGVTPICPQMAINDGASLSVKEWLGRIVIPTLETLRRSDALCMIRGWENSRYACFLRNFAADHEIPVLDDVGEFGDWFNTGSIRRSLLKRLETPDKVFYERKIQIVLIPELKCMDREGQKELAQKVIEIKGTNCFYPYFSALPIQSYRERAIEDTDILLMPKGWEKDKEAIVYKELAEAKGKPVFIDLNELKAWNNDMSGPQQKVKEKILDWSMN
jgi:hypothetical protein